MGIITGWLGCTPEAAIIEFSVGVLLFFGWFFTMRALSYFYTREKKLF